jgi:low affinity Fe/Cu permease
LRVRASAKTALVRLFLQWIAQRAPSIVGWPWSFLGLLATVIVWLALGAPFDYSGNWLLIPATATSVGAVILVVLLQYTQNRDTRAIQLKLDELIRGLQNARTHLVRLEQLSDDELDELEQEFRRLRETA